MQEACRQLDEMCASEFDSFCLLMRGHFDWVAGLRVQLEPPSYHGDEDDVAERPSVRSTSTNSSFSVAANPPGRDAARWPQQIPNRVALTLPNYIPFVGRVEPGDLRDSDSDNSLPANEQSPVPKIVDCESGSSDDESAPSKKRGRRKKRPLWAQKKKLLEQLKKQRRKDPGQYFAPVLDDECPLDLMFDMPKERFQSRKDSGRWPDADAVTAEDEVQFRTARGFLDLDCSTNDE
jgi:hypothetical protein